MRVLGQGRRAEGVLGQGLRAEGRCWELALALGGEAEVPFIFPLWEVPKNPYHLRRGHGRQRPTEQELEVQGGLLGSISCP